MTLLGALLGKQFSCRGLKATDPRYRKEITLMDRPWFDSETGTLMLDEYVVEMDSYRRIVDDELAEQTQRVTSLLQQLEGMLSPEAKAIATEALGELTVLHALQVKRLQAASMLPQ